jgi:hypothetical protein
MPVSDSQAPLVTFSPRAVLALWLGARIGGHADQSTPSCNRSGEAEPEGHQRLLD